MTSLNPASKKILKICAGLYLAAQVLFLINIQFPRTPNFDEFHYVPSAKQFLNLQVNQNWEHPPLGKILMAVGIAIGGDRPIGWRLMSTIFGSLTLVGMFLWALAIFRNQKIALWVALLTLCNQLLYVQSRIGMLDTFMFAFIVWGLAAFSWTWNPQLGARDQRRALLASGIFFGLATASKWFAVIPWFTCIALVGLVRVLQYWGVSFAKNIQKNPADPDFYEKDLWKEIHLPQWFLFFIAVPLFAYFSTFLPYLLIDHPDYTLSNFLGMQKRMFEGQLRVVTTHPYMSNWPDWPFLKRPIWYAFDKEGTAPHDFVRGVILLGNPLIMWSGMLALVACLWGWISERSREAFLILAFYAAFFVSWIIIPRKVAFYYYYYPAGMTLSLAIAYVFEKGEAGLRRPWARWIFLGAAAGVFVYFFPVLAALRIPADTFRNWMWLSSWI